MPISHSLLRPWVAAILNAMCCPPGLGYLYLGQFRKALVTFCVLAALQGANLIGTFFPQGITQRLVWPISITLALLTALDAWHLAHRSTGRPPPGAVAIPALNWLGHDSKS